MQQIFNGLRLLDCSIGSIKSSGPEFGAHNKEIYTELLGYTEGDIKKWKRDKLI